MIKKWMAALLAVLMLTGAAALAAADDDVQITATGSAQVTAVPDMFCVTANASARAETVGKAQEQISVIVEQMKQALQAVGVTEDQIVTTSYGYYPAYDYSSYDETGVNKIIGYQANHTMRITCTDPALLDSVVTAITDAGITEIYDVQFDTSARKELYQRALEMAVSDAQDKAARLASAGGVVITGVEQLIENESYGCDPALLTSARAEKADGVSTGIQAGAVTVCASVTAVYDAKK